MDAQNNSAGCIFTILVAVSSNRNRNDFVLSLVFNLFLINIAINILLIKPFKFNYNILFLPYYIKIS